MPKSRCRINLKAAVKQSPITEHVKSSESDSVEDEGMRHDETFKKVFADALEGLQIKSSVVRTKYLTTICELMNKYKPALISDFKETLLESVVRCIKKGKDLEVIEGLKLIPLLCIQLECGQELCSELNETLKTFIHNPVVCYPIRTLSCEILGVLNFLIGSEDSTIFEIMTSLEDLLNDSYLRGSSSESFGQSGAELYISALQTWGLLYTLIPEGTKVNLSWVPNLAQLLVSSNLALRLIAGESIVLLMESNKAQEYPDKWLEDQLKHFVFIIKGLSNKTYKIVAKHDRKVHSSLIKDIVNFYEEEIIPNRRVKLDNETLLLDSWALQIQYKCIKEFLGTSMKVHLCKNNFLRSIFNLGPIPEPLNKTALKFLRTEQSVINAVANRSRTILRNKSRDKRTPNDFLNEDYF